MANINTGKEFAQVIKADMTLTHTQSNYCEPIALAKSNAKTIVRIFAVDALTSIGQALEISALTWTSVSGDATTTNNAGWKIRTVPSGTTIVAGGLIAEFVIPPVWEDMDDVYLIIKTKHTSDAALNSKKIKVVVSMLQ